MECERNELYKGQNCDQQDSNDIKTEVFGDTIVSTTVNRSNEEIMSEPCYADDIKTEVFGDTIESSTVNRSNEEITSEPCYADDIKKDMEAHSNEEALDEATAVDDTELDTVDHTNEEIVIEFCSICDTPGDTVDNPDEEIRNEPISVDSTEEDPVDQTNEDIRNEPISVDSTEEDPVDQSNEEIRNERSTVDVTKMDTADHSNEGILNEPISANESDDKTVKIVVFGKDGAGKTALIVRLLTRRFIHEYDPTSEDVYAHHCVIDGDQVVLKIMDTAGMVERNIHEREEQIRWGDGFLLVLSLTNSESLKVLHLIRALIEEVNACEKPMALVANKKDLLHAREVPPSAVSDLAEKWNCSAFETAATEDYTVVEEPFFFLYTEVMKKKRSRTEPPAKTNIDSELVLADVNKRFEINIQKNVSNTEHHVENPSEVL